MRGLAWCGTARRRRRQQGRGRGRGNAPGHHAWTGLQPCGRSRGQGAGVSGALRLHRWCGHCGFGGGRWYGFFGRWLAASVTLCRGWRRLQSFGAGPLIPMSLGALVGQCVSFWVDPTPGRCCCCARVVVARQQQSARAAARVASPGLEARLSGWAVPSIPAGCVGCWLPQPTRRGCWV